MAGRRFGDRNWNNVRTFFRPLLPFVVAASCLAAAGQVLAEGTPCPDDRSTAGFYRNYSYGFTVVIPKGLEGRWNSAACVPHPQDGCVCMGDHGRELPLPGGGSISIDANPQVFEESLATAAYKGLRDFEGRTDASTLVVEVFEQRRRKALPSYRYVARSSQTGMTVVRESTHVVLPSGGHVVISIEAPEQQYIKHHPAYVALLDSLRPSVRN
jgi:hypothetical protein